MKIKVEKKNILSKDQMRMMSGGGTCGYTTGVEGGGIWCGLSKETAMLAQSNYGGYWCCDSCASNGGSASYC